MKPGLPGAAEADDLGSLYELVLLAADDESIVCPVGKCKLDVITR